MLCLLCSLGMAAQTKSITGVVTDGTGETVIGASILEVGTSNGTITDLEGKFSLSVATGAKLTISYIGYKTQTITVGAERTYNVVLKEDSEVLDEVVVTGYGGSQKRAALTTAISKLDNAVLKNAAFSNAGQSLQGSVTGLRVTNNSGQPGSSPEIILRGGATITGDNSKALIVVDGIVRNDMNDINPADIESMQVLKDAASTAIYGARANGGVILIETKSGKEGKASVNYKFKIGTNFSRKGQEFCNAEDYIYYNRMGAKRYNDAGLALNPDTQQGYGIGNNLYDIRYLNDETAHLKNQGWRVMDDPYNAGKQIIYKDHGGEMDDEVFENPAITQDHYLSITGGNDKATFVASLGYYDEQGQIKGTGYKRFNGSVNGSYKVFPILTVKAGATYSYSEQPTLSWVPGTYEFFYRTRGMRPTWNPWNEDGTPASGIQNASDGNPAYFRDKLTNENGTRRATYNIGFTLDILPKKLVLNGNASLFNYDYQKETFDRSYKLQDQTPNNTRKATAAIDRYYQTQFNGTLTYNDTFAQKHNVEVMVGGEYFTYDQFKFSAETTNSPTDDIPTLNVGALRTATSSEKTAYRILSGFGRINYNYEMKYLLSVVARYDGISRLSDNRWGFFPGVSMGWNVMEENFWKESKVAEVVSNLKPRLSYGVNGNVNGIGNFIAYGEYGQIEAKTYGGETAIYNKVLLNNSLRWEQSQTFEAGLDIGFLNNKLNFILDYYNRTTKDLLTKQDLPNYTGFKDIMTNMGTLRNYGFEMEVRANILNNPRGLSWDVTANLSTVANKIVKLPTNSNKNNRVGGQEIWDPSRNELVWVGGRQEGGKLGELVAYKQNHIFRDWDDVKKYANNRIDNIANLYGPGKADEYKDKEGWKPIQPGDVCWDDIDGNGIIDTPDRVVIGNVFPNVTGGFSTTLDYKSFKLYARFDYALGHTLYNDLAARTMGQYQGSWNIITEVKNMWSETNTDTDLPAFYFADQNAKKNITRSNNAQTASDNNSSRFYEKADYLALRELTLSYSLPKTWIKKAAMTDASVFITGQNLCYFTGYTGVSPEPAVTTTYGRGIDNGRYPTPRTVLFGLSVTF